MFLTCKKIVSSYFFRKRPFYVFSRVFRWMIVSRILRTKILIFPFINHSALQIRKGMHGATSNYYLGLADFSEMSFLLHFLRPKELFVDVGANVGVYTVIASACCDAYSIACEPVKETILSLEKNIELNNLKAMTEIHQIALSDEKGVSKCTTQAGPMNRLVGDQNSHEETIEVKLNTLDDILDGKKPKLIKIDTEGHDYQVLQGAKVVLEDQSVEAIIVELWRLRRIHEYLLSYKFELVDYDPLRRELIRISDFKRNNAIYVRNFENVSRKLKSAQSFRVFGLEI